MKTWQKLRENPRLWERYFVREQVIKAIRMFFEKQTFHEIEAPLLISNPAAESYLDMFQTTLLDRTRNGVPAYLSTSPETAIKKLLVAGVGNCYCLTKSFRNMELQSNTHNPEFTILEWYRIGVPYERIMDDCETLILFMSRMLGRGATLTYQNKSFNLTKPWKRLSVREAFQTYAGIDLVQFMDMEHARDIATKKGYGVTPQNTWEELYNQIYLNEIEPHLGIDAPTILYEFPSAVAALAQKNPRDTRFALRFEFYIAGLELGDCYQELTDWKEQEDRFEKELLEIKRLGKTPYDYDHDFIEALKVGMPQASGIAVGVDRLVMLFTNTTSIADTLFFPVSELFEN